MQSSTPTSIPVQEPWYAQAWFTILMLIFLAPVGWFLLWKYRSWNVGMKVAATVFSLIFFAYASAEGAKEDAKKRAAQESAKTNTARVTSSRKSEPSSQGSPTDSSAVIDNDSATNSSRAKTSRTAALSQTPIKRSQQMREEPASSDSNTENDQLNDVDKNRRGRRPSNVAVIDFEGIGKREVGLVDKVEYVISEMQKMRSISSEFSNTEADGMFFIIRLAAYNRDKETHDINTARIKLTDDQDREFDPSRKGGTALLLAGDKTAETFLMQIQPGTSKKFTLVYDGPEDAKGLRLKIPAGSFSFGRDAIIKVP